MLQQFLKIFLRLLNWFLKGLGILSLVLIILSFTDQPWHVYHWLGTYHDEVLAEPDYIVVMGAGGVPGRESLIRCYYGAAGAAEYPVAEIIVAMPTEPAYIEESDAMRMALFMAELGADTSRMLFETKGTNTYTQALEINKMIPQGLNRNLLIVTSPDHMYRSIRTFRKSGFDQVYGLPAFEGYLDESTLLTKEEKEKGITTPDRNINLRYNMWTYLKYEITLIREGIAIAWYELRGYM